MQRPFRRGPQGGTLLLTLTFLALLPPVARAEAAGNKLILDETAYWRYLVCFGPDSLDAGQLRGEGGKLLDARALQRLEGKVKRYWQPPFATSDEARGFDDADWRDHARIWFPVGQGDSERAALNVRSEAPPAGWMAPDFDAAAPGWPRQRMPLMVGNVLRPSNMHGDKDMQQLGVRAAYFRTTFEVADPAAADCTLSVAFRGGARVFVNGREIARKYLAAGDLAAHAEVYPAEAYVCQKDEVPEKRWESEMSKVGVAFCEDLPGKFDDAFADGVPREGRTYWNSCGRSSFAGYFGGWTQITREGFDRVTALRNRTIGPVNIPTDVLRKGTNVLAIEVRASHIHPVVVSDRGMEWGRAFQRVMYWSHCRLLEVDLRSASDRAVSALKRPAGVQIWAEDVHRRCWTGDFGPAAGSPPTVRVVGAINGIYSGQLVVGTDRELKALSVAASALTSADGKSEIPASAVRIGYMVSHPATELVKLGQIRNTVQDRSDPLCPPAENAIVRFGPPEARSKRLPREQRLAMLSEKDLRFFDHIGNPSRERGVDVPSDTCQPVWIWVSIPADAAPGAYEGTLTVRADGMEPASAALKVEVIGWRLAGASEFQTIIALEQSPYGLAKHYGVELWSDEHFNLLESSFAELARVGNDVVFVPCLQNTEFGNFEDTVIRWVRRKDGSLTFDYTDLDRYLALACKARGSPPVGFGAPRMICFVVMHGADRFGPGSHLASTVSVFDEATGRSAPLDLSTNAEGYREAWKAFVPDLYSHMVDLGLDGSMRWGFVWDNEGDPVLPALLGELLPELTWARSGHGGHPGGRFTFACSSLGFGFTESSRMGWKGPLPDLLCPRSGSATLSSNGHSPPFSFRLAVDRAIVAGANGVGRLGADYFADIFFRGYTGSLSGGIAGMPCSTLLWPGPAGAEPGARFEALREGVQETEARIYLEQALDRGLIEGELAARVRDVLFRHNRETLYVSPGRVGEQVHEYTGGWQQRSRRLLATAAEVAEVLPMDVDATELGGKVPARAAVPIALTLRNWTNRTRQFTVSADQPWIVLDNLNGNPRLPAGAVQNAAQASTEGADSPPRNRGVDVRKQGVCIGHLSVRAVIDTNKLAPGATAEGKITVTDTAAGRSFVVPIKANVGAVMDLVMPAWDMLGAPGHAASFDPKRIEDYATFNVPVGGSESDEFALVNLSGTDLAWKIAPSAEWLSVAPGGGKLAPGERAFVKVTAKPKTATAARLACSLTVTTADGSAELMRRVVCHVIPPYVAPNLPVGAATDLKDLPTDRIVSHKSVAYWVGTSSKERADYGPVFGPRGNVDHTAGAADTTMIAGVEQETVYRIEGLSATAFSASVAIPKAYAKPSLTGTHKAQANFEVYADGKLVAQSGLMTPGDEPRPIVATPLSGAKELKLVTRFARPGAESLRRRMYVHWVAPKLHKKP